MNLVADTATEGRMEESEGTEEIEGMVGYGCGVVFVGELVAPGVVSSQAAVGSLSLTSPQVYLSPHLLNTT